MDLINTRPVIPPNIGSFSSANLVSYWSRAIFIELGGRVYITKSSQNRHLWTVQNIEGYIVYRQEKEGFKVIVNID